MEERPVEEERPEDQSKPHERIAELEVELAAAKAKKADAEARAASQKAFGDKARAWREWVQLGLLILGPALGGYALATRAPSDKVEKNYDRTREAIERLDENVQKQHEATKEAVEFTEKATEAVASAIPPQGPADAVAPSSTCNDFGECDSGEPVEARRVVPRAPEVPPPKPPVALPPASAAF
jgi:hypothetical protein